MYKIKLMTSLGVKHVLYDPNTLTLDAFQNKLFQNFGQFVQLSVDQVKDNEDVSNLINFS